MLLMKRIGISHQACTLEGSNRALSLEVGGNPKPKTEQMRGGGGHCHPFQLSPSLVRRGRTSSDAREERWGSFQAPLYAKELLKLLRLVGQKPQSREDD